MKITLLPFGIGPDHYTFDGEAVTAHYDGVSESYDLSGMPEGATLASADPVNGMPAIHAATRISGELHVALFHRVIAGQYPGRKAHWRTGDPIDATEYDPNTCYGVPTGMVGVEDYEIVQGTDVAGTTGWTVRKAEGE